jgi:hypothetical protein
MTTIQHPDYGTLTIHERIGRSRRCTKENGESVTLSTRALNKLSRPAPTVNDTPTTPDELVGFVTGFLSELDDGPVRVRTAKQLWDLANGYLAQ